MRADELLALQRALLAALREPLTGDSRARTPLPPSAAAPPERFAATARAWLTPSASLDEPARLELYHRQYWFRALDSLEEDFPAVALLLGRAPFWELLERYLLAHPPRTHSLRYLGAGFADFLAQRTFALPHPVHAEELARLEWAWIEAFDAAELPAAPAEQLAEVPLGLQPHLTLLACRTAADALWLRAIEERPRGRLAPATEPPRRFVAVFRDGDTRDVERLHPAAFALLSSLAAQGSLAVALEAAAPRLPARRGAALVRGWFATWTARRWLVPRAAPSSTS
ncbi:MAG: DNA-binding domain-containing protein [Kofleriaceae bacterium]